MFFWGPLTGPGVITKKSRVAARGDIKVFWLGERRFNFFLTDLDPDGCLVAGQLWVRTKTLEKPGADN